MNQKVYPKAMNLDAISQRLQDTFSNEGFEVQKMGSPDDVYVQLRKGGVVRTATGLNQAITVHMQRVGATTSVTLGQAAWASKAGSIGVGAAATAASFGILFPLMITGAVGAWNQRNLPLRVWKSIDDYAMSQAMAPGAQVGEMGAALMGIQQGVHCPHCGVTNSGDAQFCNACGTKLK